FGVDIILEVLPVGVDSRGVYQVHAGNRILQERYAAAADGEHVGVAAGDGTHARPLVGSSPVRLEGSGVGRDYDHTERIHVALVELLQRNDGDSALLEIIREL